MWYYTYCPVLTKDMMVFINSPMPYIMGANKAYVYVWRRRVSGRSIQALENLKGVTVVNSDEDHVSLPSDLQDYYALFPDVLGFPSKEHIPKDMRDSVLPPLPVVAGMDLYAELRKLVHPVLSFGDSTSFAESRFDSDAGRR